MNTRMLIASTLLLGTTTGACASPGADDSNADTSQSLEPASALVADDGSSAIDESSIDWRSSIKMQDQIKFSLGSISQDQVEFDLASTSHSAMVMVIKCDLGSDACKAKFDPKNSEPIYLPVTRHCGEDSYYDCGDSDSSFAEHRDDYYVRACGHPKMPHDGMTGSFIARNRIITAAHHIEKDHLDRLFFVMNQVQVDHQWPTVDLDDDGVPDHVRIDPRFVLAVESVVDCEYRKIAPPDWAVFEVRPLLEGQTEIPPHAAFVLAETDPSERTPIHVLAHPRMLPVKLADGIITPPRGADSLFAAFDVSQGSSGSPALLVDSDVIVGINRVQSKQIVLGTGSNERRREHRCTLDQLGNGTCSSQPLTPASRIKRILDDPDVPDRICCHLKKQGAPQ